MSTLPQALHWPESTSFKNIFSLIRGELNQAWILAFSFQLELMKHDSLLPPPLATSHTVQHSILPVWRDLSYHHSLCFNQCHPLSQDSQWMTIHLITTLPAFTYLRFPPLQYLAGLASRLSSVIIKDISPPHTKRLPKWPAAKTFQWFKWRKNRKKQGNPQVMFHVALSV